MGRHDIERGGRQEAANRTRDALFARSRTRMRVTSRGAPTPPQVTSVVGEEAEDAPRDRAAPEEAES